MTERGPGSVSAELLRARLRVGRIFGVPVSIHWSWFLSLFVWVIWGGTRYSSGPWDAGEFIAIFVIVFLHELGHILAAQLYDLHAREIILWPLGGLAQIERFGSWRSELTIVAAGPLVNLVLTPISFLCWYVLGYHAGGDINQLLWSIAQANVAMLVFNLLPIWPLDGGRVFQAAMTSAFTSAESRVMCSISGIVFATLGIIYFVHIQAFLAVALLTALVFVNTTTLDVAFRLLAMERRDGFHDSAVCPRCKCRAIDDWRLSCTACHERFDSRVKRGRCPKCTADAGSMWCRYCGQASKMASWFA